MWPEWANSMVKSRELLGYDPKWPIQDCKDWANRNYSKIRAEGEAELRRMGLPPTLQQYWEDCFYVDYQNQNGGVNYSKITRFFSRRKSYPDLPCNYGIVWYPEEDIDDPWLRIEIRLHARFATKELYDYAAKWGWETVKERLLIERLSGRGISPHPVALKINKAKVESPAWSKSAIEAWESTFSIDETLRRLYFSSEVHADRETELSSRQTQHERQTLERDFRKRFRDRVIKTLRRAGVEVPRPKTKWWLAESAKGK